MLRVWLRRDDLVRIRFSPGPSPLAAVMLSTQSIRHRHAVLYDRWRRRSITKLPPRSRALFDLVPATGYLPDFLTPVITDAQLESELDAVRATSHRRMLADLSIGGRRLQRNPIARRLVADDHDAWRLLDVAVRDYFSSVLADDWQRLRAHHRADVSYRAAQIAAAGLDGMLSTLHPDIRWDGSVLQINGVRDGDVHLDGRGLLLMPSVFVWPTPRFRSYGDSAHPAVLVYPARNPFAVWQEPSEERGDPVAALVGRTRAAILRALDTDEEQTTGGLAARLSVSAATASQHATTLRAAGLVTTTRRGQSVFHRLTALGEAVLDHSREAPTAHAGGW